MSIKRRWLEMRWYQRLAAIAGLPFYIPAVCLMLLLLVVAFPFYALKQTIRLIEK